MTVAAPPRVRFETRVHDDDTFTVWAIDREPERVVAQHAWHIADVFFNGGEWLLIKYDKDGEIVHPVERWIDVDHQEWAHLRDITNENAKDRHNRPDAVNAALDAELAIRRLKFRDDTREDARMMGLALARIWWRSMSETL